VLSFWTSLVKLNPKIFERSSYLLKKLDYKDAEQLLLSKDFRKNLDGAIAQSVLPKIHRLEAIRDGVDLKTLYAQEIQDIYNICGKAKVFKWTEYDNRTALVEAFRTEIDTTASAEGTYEMLGALDATDYKSSWPLFKKGMEYFGVKNYQCKNLELFYNGQFNKLNPKIKVEK